MHGDTKVSRQRQRGASPMSLASLALVSIALLMSLCGCATSNIEAVFSEPRPLGKEVTPYQPPRQPSAAALAPRQFEEPTGILALRQALALALRQNPDLAAVAWEVRASEARTLQAGLRPNPGLGLSIENFAGSGVFTGFEGAETTAHLSQVLEVGGKHRRRLRVAALERDLVAWDYETTRVDVITQVRKAFVEVLSTQEHLTLHEELIRLSERVYRTVLERVKAGKVSPVEVTKAQLVLSTSRLALGQARRDQDAARVRLAATWGSTSPRFEKAEGQLDAIAAPPSLEEVAQRLAQNPDIARWHTAMAQRQAAVALEEARRVPDLTVGAGLRHLNETDDTALVMDVSVPLPIFNRNQGGVREAYALLAKAGEERRAAVGHVGSTLAGAYAILAAAFAQVTGLQRDVLPGAQRTFEAVQEGYRQGKFALLEVLDAQRTLFEARGQYIAALAAYHEAVAEVERLIGERLPAVTNAAGQP